MYFKILGLLALAASVCATSASADELTSPSGGTATSIHATSEGHTVWDAPFGSVECSSTIAGSITQQGPGLDIKGNFTTVHFTNCTGNKTFSVLQKGTLTLDVTATNSGTLTWTGMELTVFDHSLGIDCIYRTSNTHIGTVTGSSTSHATLHIESAAMPRTGGSFFCGSSAEWTGSYTFTGPNPLHLDP